MKKGKNSLCWNCKRAMTCECCWIRSYLPVIGWQAQPTTVHHRYCGKVIKNKSFFVFSCPNFIEDDVVFVTQTDIARLLNKPNSFVSGHLRKDRNKTKRSIIDLKKILKDKGFVLIEYKNADESRVCGYGLKKITPPVQKEKFA